MTQFIENITVAKEVVFNDTLHKVSVKTDKVLDKNIIAGKLVKQGVELLTFEKIN